MISKATRTKGLAPNITAIISANDNIILPSLFLDIKGIDADISIDIDDMKLEGKVKELPLVEETGLPVEVSTIFEFYSR